MVLEEPAGFSEVEHTADWEIEIWAPDLPALMEQAAFGMYALAGVKLEQEERVGRRLHLKYLDDESLLVEFLTELQWFIEDQNLAFDQFMFAFVDNFVQVDLYGARITKLYKEIKAVTYHNMNIQQDSRGLYVRVVFDV